MANGEQAIDPEHWLLAGLGLLRVTTASVEAWRSNLELLKRIHFDWGALPPPGVVADMAQLFRGGRLDTTRAIAPRHRRLERALGAYDDHVLARLAGDPRLRDVQDAIASLPERQQPTAIALACTTSLTRLAYHPSVRLGPGQVRRLVAAEPAPALARGFEIWRSSPSVLEVLARDYQQLAQAARQQAGLLAPSDVFLLENIEVLARLGQRVAIGQVVDAADALVRSWPRRLLARPQPGEVNTALLGESHYPTGGFSGISNFGVLENLVSSELVYMDRSSELDLFDVRYAEGELLYYSRDEGNISRRRRQLHFVLHPSLVRARTKDPAVPWQRVIVVLALLLGWTRQLTRWLADEDLRLCFDFWQEPRRAFELGEESELLGLVLREWAERGALEIGRSTPADIVERCHKEQGALVEVVVVGDDAGWAAWQQASGKSPVRQHQLSLEPRSWEQWRADGLELLARLV